MKEIELKEGQKLYGYAGKILRINLTDSTTEIIPTSKYAPKYIGGWALCNAIFWDDIKKPIPL
jgi:aldehyde:ferredoxin oxidoreductase